MSTKRCQMNGSDHWDSDGRQFSVFTVYVILGLHFNTVLTIKYKTFFWVAYKVPSFGCVEIEVY